MPSIAPSAGILRRASEWAREARELGGLPVALAAYQVGPNVAGRWKDRVAEEPRRAGGEALVCELAVDPSVSQWVRSVLAARAAYAELRPTTRQP